MANGVSTGTLLLVAATELELCDYAGVACGIGPVEAAAATARALAVDPPSAVLHVGIAGGRRLTPGALVVGTEAVYVDLVGGDPGRRPGRARSARSSPPRAPRLPEAISLPIATSAAVSGRRARAHDLRVEGMEGFAVLRACQRAGVPAVEVRASRTRSARAIARCWMIRRGARGRSPTRFPRLLAALAE